MRPQKILDLIGNTPLVETTNLIKNKNVKLLLKLEGNNPGGSLKDRAAYNMIASALARGEIKKGDKLIEATSGNTGIALAMIAQLFNIEIELVLPEDSTKERTQTMLAYGARCSHRRDKMGYRSFRIIPYFRTCGFIMCFPVVIICKLI